LTTFHPPELRWRSIPGDLSIKVDLSGDIASKSLDVATASDWGWEVNGSKFKPKWTMLTYQQRRNAWSSFHANALNVQGEL